MAVSVARCPAAAEARLFDCGGLGSREINRTLFLLVTLQVIHAVRRHFAETWRPFPVVLVLAKQECDIDVLFVGNLHPAVQRERSRWLGRLVAFRDRWHIVIRTGVFGEDYRQLLRRAKIGFNRLIRGECNQQAPKSSFMIESTSLP